jgi:opacity protein-like surface antigen
MYFNTYIRLCITCIIAMYSSAIFSEDNHMASNQKEAHGNDSYSIDGKTGANSNSRPVEFRIYGGTNRTSITADKLILWSETDSLKRINPSSRYDNGTLWGAGIATELVGFTHSSRQHTNIALNVFYTKNKQTGNVYQFQNLEYDNFDYTINLQSTRLMTEIEWFFYNMSKISPFIQGGIGVAFNRLHYCDYPNAIFNASPSDGNGVVIKPSTRAQFAFSLGGGAQMQVTDKVLAGIRYFYSDQGKGRTARIANLPLLEPLHASIYSHNVAFHLAYVA